MTTEIISITEKALGKIKEIAAAEQKNDNQALRLAVMGGGCSGFSYKIEFSEIKESDNIISKDNISIVIDPKSSIYLNGTTLDYQDGLKGKGFTFNNPNAKNTCGCGESFSL